MKKQKILLGAAGLLALGLTACSNEMPVQGEVAQNDEVRFLRVAIANPPSTRAAADDAEFEDGSAVENAAENIVLKFFDASGNPLSVTPTKVDGTDKGWQDATDATGAPSVGKIKEAVFQLSIPRGTGFPSYVMCYINPVSYAEDAMGNKSMYELRDEEREDYTDDSDNFAMTNSVYYGTNPLTGASQVKISATPIKADQLYTSVEDAKNSTAAVDIYVERYAAKVKFTLSEAEGAIQPQTLGAYTLSFNPEKWTINADAQSMYVVKRFADNDSETTGIPTINQVQASLGSWTTWNDAALHRSFWACSPGFYATEFPRVSDDIIDQVTGGNTGAGELVGDYKLRYYSYNQITDLNKDSEGFGVDVIAGATNTKYVLENTMGADAFNCLNPKAAAPSVLLVGSYTVSKDGQSVTSADGFCTYNSHLYYRTAVHPSDADGKTIMDAFLAANQILFINQTGTLLNDANATEAIKGMFEVVHPSKAVRDLQGQPTPHRYVTLQLKKGEGVDYTGLYYRPMGTDVRQPVSAAVVDQLNLQLWSQLGVARAYTQNKGYFSIPIQHLGITENTVDNPIVDGVIDWKKVRVGDFGLVRNHVYDIQVSGIQGMASGIEDLDNPLVPSMDENEYYVKYKINILNWRVVPAQENIILK